MSTFVKGDMWDVFGKTDLFVITTNPIIRKDGAVVMGRGIAKQAKERFPELPYAFAHKLTEAMIEQDYVDILATSNTGIIGRFGGQVIGWFMVKDHWRSNADLAIIERSIKELTKIARLVPQHKIDLNFPGIGNGKLDREEVLPLLEALPANVRIWEYA